MFPSGSQPVFPFSSRFGSCDLRPPHPIQPQSPSPSIIAVQRSRVIYLLIKPIWFLRCGRFGRNLPILSSSSSCPPLPPLPYRLDGPSYIRSNSRLIQISRCSNRVVPLLPTSCRLPITKRPRLMGRPPPIPNLWPRTTPSRTLSPRTLPSSFCLTKTPKFGLGYP